MNHTIFYFLPKFIVKEFIFVKNSTCFIYLCFNFKENLMYHSLKFINDISNNNLTCFSE